MSVIMDIYNYVPQYLEIILEHSNGLFVQVLELADKEDIELRVQLGQHLDPLLLIDTTMIPRCVLVKGLHGLSTNLVHLLAQVRHDLCLFKDQAFKRHDALGKHLKSGLHDHKGISSCTHTKSVDHLH